MDFKLSLFVLISNLLCYHKLTVKSCSSERMRTRGNVRKMRVKFRSLEIPSATLVANEFIDRYMAKANGEFVKVYLWLLRHAEEETVTAVIADALELTEGDVNRALSYWARTGMITVLPGGEQRRAEEAAGAGQRIEEPEDIGRNAAGYYGTELRNNEPEVKRPYGAGLRNTEQEAAKAEEAEQKPAGSAAPAGNAGAEKIPAPNEAAGKIVEAAGHPGESRTDRKPLPNLPETAAAEPSAPAKTAGAVAQNQAGAALPASRPVPDKSGIDIRKLKNDEEFSNLLYVVQRYLSKIFSQTDTETVAYLYDVLKMPSELIEYLAEMCAERGKNSLRYIETVALNWHTRGIKTVEQAKREADLYTAETYGVMKAFGLSGRNPGTEEQKLIKKWFSKYGFTAELVHEACARTLAATQKPSFRYADSILTRWHEAGVRTKADVEKTDSEHQDKVRSIRTPEHIGKNPGNRFNNFEQRDDDIDEIALELMKKKLNQN